LNHYPNQHFGKLSAFTEESKSLLGKKTSTIHHNHPDGTGKISLKDFSELQRSKEKLLLKKPYFWEHISLEVAVLLFILIANKSGQELAISAMPFVGREVFQLGSEAPGYYMAVVGLLVWPMNLFVNQLIKDFEERDLVLKLLYTTLFGTFLICHFGLFGDYSLFQYWNATAIIFTSLNALEGIIMSILSKVISPELAKGTFNSGLLATEAGTFGRVIGDMTIVIFGGSGNESAHLVNQMFWPLALLIVASLLLINRTYERFIE
jgi:hypothetical protein